MDESDAVGLTPSKEANHIHVHEAHLLHIQNDRCSASLDLRLQFAQELRSYSSNEPELGRWSNRNLFDSERHFQVVLRCTLEQSAIAAPSVTS